MLAPLLLVLTLMPGPWTAAAVLVLLGGLVGGMDVAMNANAVAVERRMGRAIMSSCHAWWSVGALIGAATGGVLIARFGPLGHSAAVIPRDARGGRGGGERRCWPTRRRRRRAQGGRPARGLPGLLALLVGVMALFSMIPEGAVLDWSALYLKQELGASIEAAGLAFAAFSATMAIMRFSGDLDPRPAGGGADAADLDGGGGDGAARRGLGGERAGSGGGFAFAGIGIANMVPIAFSAAGNLPGLRRGSASRR